VICFRPSGNCIVQPERSAAGDESSRRDVAVGLACATLSVLLFSSFTLLSRLGLSSSLQVTDLAALRFGVGGTLLLPVVFHYRHVTVRLETIAALALSGGLGFALLAYSAFALAPASHAAVLLHGTLPLTTAVVSQFGGSPEKITAKVSGLFLIGAGAALMAWDSLFHASTRQLAGDGLLVLASFTWSIYGVLARRVGLAPAHSASLVAVVSMLVYLPIYVLLPHPEWSAITAHDWLLQAIIQGALIGATSVFVYTRAVSSLGAANTSLFAAAVPPLTTLAAIPLLSELPNTTRWIGIALVTLGMIAAARERWNAQARRRAAAPARACL
jgi:drug/metabolite transporter (DMT)-like permease